MKKDNVNFIKEKELQKKAKKNFEESLKFQTNPMKAKIEAFKKTKKEIKPKDLF